MYGIPGGDTPVRVLLIVLPHIIGAHFKELGFRKNRIHSQRIAAIHQR